MCNEGHVLFSQVIKLTISYRFLCRLSLYVRLRHQII